MTPEQTEMNKLLKRIINVEDYGDQLKDDLEEAKLRVTQIEKEIVVNDVRITELNNEFDSLAQSVVKPSPLINLRTQ